MDRKDNLQLKVGIFVGFALLVLIVVMFFLGSERKIFDSQYALVAHFKDISGLRVGAPVQLAGINVGTVDKILFSPNLEKKKVKLELRVSKKYMDRIREDSVATIVTQGLLGDKLVYVSVGSSDKNVLKSGDEVKAGLQTDLNAVLEKGEVTMEEVKKVASNVNKILEQIQTGKGAVHAVLYDPEGEKLIADTRQLIQSFSGTAENLDDITEKISDGQGTLGALVNDASVYNDLKTLLGKANRNKLVRAVIRTMLKTHEEKAIGGTGSSNTAPVRHK